MEKLRILFIIIISILIGIFGYMTYVSIFKEQPQPAHPVSPSPISSPIIQNIQPTAIPSNSWQEYTSIPLGFSIQHPSDLPPRKQGETIVFSKWGPSQREATEFFDGISLSFSSGFYNNNFEDVARQKLQEAKEWPTYVSSTVPQALALAGKEAWSFTMTSMAKSNYMFIKKSNTEYLEIINSTQDPTNQGFDKIITQMLDSLKIE